MACVAVVAFSGACLGPTQLVVDVRTNVPCTDSTQFKGVAIYVGEPGIDVETRAPQLATNSCDASGEVGTLVVTPTGANDAQVGIRVVAGLTRNPEECAAKNYDGCIVARRTVRYLAHTSQTVVVALTSDCVGNACDLNHTCVNGSCTDTLTATGPVAPDGGVLLSGPTVRCGDYGTRCAANDSENVCCVTFASSDAGASQGACVNPAACPSTSALLRCDDSSDCPAGDASDPLVCCASKTDAPEIVTNSICTPLSACLLGGHGGGQVLLCQDRGACPTSGDALNCIPADVAPGYYRCD